jgi:hypothetical protein
MADMSTRNSERTVRGIVLGLVLLGATGLGIGRWVGHASATRLIHDYSPDRRVPRIPLTGPSVEAIDIDDFDLAHDDLYLLDRRAARVTALHRGPDGWKVTHAFARRGGGPGELLEPSSIAVTGDPEMVAVADEGSLHYFLPDGTYVRTRTPSMPCVMFKPHIGATGTGLLVSGTCAHGDTTFAEVYHLADDDSVTFLARDMRYTFDGGGSTFGTKSFFSSGPDVGLFGGGITNCVFRVARSPSLPTVRQLCDVGFQRFAFTASPELSAKLKAISAARPSLGAAATVPVTFPTYIGAIDVDGEAILLRPFSIDSLVVRKAGSGEDLAVLPVAGFIGCRTGGCLWFGHDDSGTIALISNAQFAALAQRAEAR